ncbi:methyl-accepting chemotaxis protein [Jeotgalibacillus malaysiensis]|uniref:methyl-accepting chemotaxis protein n=1 Tax=Jeotgalibacillus malaysiensis TaxID=1508404 RepID=UPI00384BE500
MMKGSVGQKLVSAFLVVALIFAASGVYSYINMRAMSQTFEDVTESLFEARAAILELESTVHEQNSTYRGFLLSSQSIYLDTFYELNAETEAISERIESLITDETSLQLLSSINNKNTEMLTIGEDLLPLFEANPDIARVRATGTMTPLANQLAGEANEMIDRINEDISSTLLESNASIAQARTLSAVMMGAAFLIAILLGVILTSRITKPLKSMTAMAERVADGNLTDQPIPMKGKDEIAKLQHSFIAMQDNLKNLIQQISLNSAQVAASSEELSANAEQTSRATEQTAGSIEEISRGSENQVSAADRSVESLRSVTVGIQTIAESANVIENYSNESLSHANEGGTLVENTVQNMESISHRVGESDQAIQNLSSRTDEIGSILDVIRGIADQTNLLALNAAIEAARAGEHGKGFAVVADEVRKLAEQSAGSTHKINDLIAEMQKDSSRSVETMDEVKAEVERGINAAQATQEKFQLIVGSVEQMTTQIEQMNETAQAIAAKSDEVTVTVGSMTGIAKDTNDHSASVSAAAQQTLASMEEVTSSATALTGMAEELQELIARFELPGETSLNEYEEEYPDHHELNSSEESENEEYDEAAVAEEDQNTTGEKVS